MPQPVDLQHFLHGQGIGGPLAVTGDDLGWLSIEFQVAEGTIRIERFLTEEDELRDELDTWAGWIESQPATVTTTELMQRIISTRQVFTIRSVPAVEGETQDNSEMVARWLARASQGVYQVDGRGFLGPSGELLLGEN
jgi:hypothetical protein